MRIALAVLLTTACLGGQSPNHDIRLKPEFMSGITAYKKDFQRPDWAQPVVARQVRFDGGPMFAASQLESGWNYLFDPETPGFVGVIQATPSLVNFYTHNIEHRLDQVRAAGYNWIWLSYDLGFAWSDEAEQRSQVREVIRLAHERGMRVTAYISLTSLFTRSAFLREPESKGWVQERPDGRPVAYASVPVRLMACVNKPGRLEHLKHIAQMAVSDGADDIHYDSIFNRCYCSYCRRGFREYTKRILGRAFDPPARLSTQAPTDIQENMPLDGPTGDTVWGLFVEYAGYTVAKALAELDRAAKALNPAVTLSANTHQIRYTDQVTDMTWSEEGNTRGSRISGGKLFTPLAVYAWGRAISEGTKPFQATVMPELYWTIQPREYYERTVLEAAAFQANFTMLAGYAFGTRMFRKDPVALAAWDGISAGLNFVERHIDLYRDARPVADVAVYYSFASRTLAEASKEKYDWESDIENLLLAGVPATILIDYQATASSADELAKQFRAIVLTRADCLSDEEIALLREYASKGGSLIVSETTGAHNNFLARRMNQPFFTGETAIQRLMANERLPEGIGRILKRHPPVELVGGSGFQFAMPNLSGKLGVIHVVNYDLPERTAGLSVRIHPSASKTWNNLFAHRLQAKWIPAPFGEATDLTVEPADSGIVVKAPKMGAGGLIVLTPIP